jgi:hypothetical protein
LPLWSTQIPSFPAASARSACAIPAITFCMDVWALPLCSTQIPSSSTSPFPFLSRVTQNSLDQCGSTHLPQEHIIW